MDKFIILNKEIYTKESIISSLNDFSEYLSGEIIENKKKYQVNIKFKRKIKSENYLLDEFKNYILSLNIYLTN